MHVVIAVLFETDRLGAAELRWPLRLAALRGGDVTFLVSASGEAEKTIDVDLSEGAENDPPTHELGVSIRALLDRELTPEGWAPAGRQSAAKAEAADSEKDAPLCVALRDVPTGQMLPAALQLVTDPRRDLLVIVAENLPREETQRRMIARELLRETSCEVVYMIPGKRQADGEILFEPARGPYVQQAAPLALQLAQHYQRRATGLWIEPDIGQESKRAGRQLLERLLKNTLGDEAAQVVRRVEVDDSREQGILRACADERYEVIIMGVSRPGAAGLAEVRGPLRVARGTDQPTLMGVRAAIPLGTRLQRFLDFHLRRIVPQLEREQRTDFVATVQSSSEWNFDFIAMMGLSTGIATFGLIGDSAAVIIGAMLVAPLMTPLMGIGLSMVQGNLRLAEMTLRTAFLGFLLSFVLAFCIGYLNREFGVATDEMEARHWPSLVDLAVAFVSGIAAAYASGRPGLLAALPGVAIAASLVPPIAVSGLAVSIGHYNLAAGAMLLFAVNVIAIVVGTAAVLWTVGLRSHRGLNIRARLLATTVVSVAVLTALGLAVSPPMAVPPLELLEAIDAVLGEEYRMRSVRLKHEDGLLVQIDVGGSLARHPELTGELLEVVKEHLGEDTALRLTYRHETDLR